MKLSPYIIETMSYDGKYKLLYNMKNEHFIRYDLESFPNNQVFLENIEVYNYLEKHDFLESEFEEKVIKEQHQISVDSREKMMLILKVTKNCNFKCIYCYETENKKYMTINENKIILKFLKKEFEKGILKRLTVSWFGGEPLVNFQFIEKMAKDIIHLCEAYNVEYNSSIVTNGYLLTDTIIDKLISLKIKLFQITLDGPSYIHDLQRPLKGGGTTYKSIINNLYNLRRKDGNFIVVLRTNVSKSLIKNLNQYIKDILPLFNDKRFYAKFHSVVDFNNMSHDVSDLELLNEMKNAIIKGIRFPSVKEYLSSTNFYCYASKENHYVIDPYLRISKCTEVNETYSYIGTLNGNGEIDYNDNYYLWKLAKYTEKCVNCKDYVMCDGGVCPLYYLKNHESRCMNFRHEKELLLKIADLQKEYNITIKMEKG